MKRTRVMAIAMVMVILAALPCWSAQKFPTKPIQLVCPFAPGGNSDLSARFVATKMAEILGQPLVIVNKAGGGSSVGISAVATAKPDGYTILTASAGMVLLPIVMPAKLPYKIDDLVPLGRICTWNSMIAVGKDLPVKNFAEFVAYAKKNPTTLSYSSSGVGNTSHFIGEAVNMAAKLQVQHIPFPGENPAITALLGKHVQVTYVGLPTSSEHIKTNAIKPLMVFSNKRDPVLPNVPTATEEGYPDLMAASYHVLYAPAKTDPAILKQLESALEKSLQDKDVRAKIESIGLTPNYLNPQETKKMLDNEYKKWSVVAKKANIVVK